LQRDQITKVVLTYYGDFKQGLNYCGGKNIFPDVAADSWSYQYICRAVQKDLVTGYQAGQDAGKFVPERIVNRAEFLAILLRGNTTEIDQNAAVYADVAVDDWYRFYAQKAYAWGLFDGQNLKPSESMKRREVARVIMKLAE
jgi:hypothetical protein